MPSISANYHKAQIDVRTVVFVVYPNVKLLDLAGPLQVFNDVRTENGKCAYKSVVASVDGASVQTDTCISLDTESLSHWKRRRIDTLIVVGGEGVFESLNDEQLKTDINRMAAKSRRIGSVCSGTFLLASCGLLEDRRATTHWEYADRLATDYPGIKVEENFIFIKDGRTWTSAGVTAGIDLALAMVTEDLGRAVALSLARSLVTFFVRPGGQSQFSTAMELQASDKSARFDELHRWLHSNLDKDLRVENLANQANMSPRHFSRLYLSVTGRTPAKAVEAVRTEAARRLLEEGKLSIAAIARRCGFGDDERMRRSFVRILKVSPQSYLKYFNKPN